MRGALSVALPEQSLSCPCRTGPLCVLTHRTGCECARVECAWSAPSMNQTDPILH